MKRKILLGLVGMVLLVISAGCASEKTKDAEQPVLTKVVLQVDKNEIMADGTDTVKIEIKALDQNGNILTDENVEIYLNDSLFKLKSFSTTNPGIYVVYAKSGSIESGKTTFTARDVSPKPSVIEFKPDVTAIVADGSEKVTFKVEVFDQYGDLITTKSTISYEGEGIKTTLTALTFSTTTPGNFTFTTSYGGVTSQAIKIQVTELIKVTQVQQTKNYGEILDLDTYSVGFEVASSSVTKLIISENLNTSPYEVNVVEKKAVIDKLIVDSALKSITITAYNSRNRVVGKSIVVKLKD